MLKDVTGPESAGQVSFNCYMELEDKQMLVFLVNPYNLFPIGKDESGLRGGKLVATSQLCLCQRCRIGSVMSYNGLHFLANSGDA